MPMPSKHDEHHVMLALIAAAEADGYVNANGEHLCDPNIVERYAVDVTCGYLANHNAQFVATVPAAVAALRGQPKRHAYGTAQANRAGKNARPSLVAVELTMRRLGMNPPDAGSMDPEIRRLMARVEDPATGRPYEPVSMMLAVLRGILG